MPTIEKEHFKERPIAPESLKTRRAREKLLKLWEEEKQHVTPQALEGTAEKICKWIADNAKDRVQIKEKDPPLFNRNQNAAPLSKKVQSFADRLKNDMQQLGKALPK